MLNTINSVFDQVRGLSVDEMLANPHFLPDIVTEALDGQMASQLFFTPETVNSNVIAYSEASASYLEDDVQNVAEFGEIPVTDPAAHPLITKPIEKYGLGLRISWEQRRDNEAEAVQRELIARTNTIVRHSSLEGLNALRSAPVQKLQATTAWNAGGTPATDLLDAIDLILGAEDENNRSFQYEPNIIWINPLALSALKRNEEMQKLYIGDMAHANPIFQPIANQPLLFEQIQVVPDFSVKRDEVFLGVEGLTGFLGEREPQQITDFYAERGNSELGGANMSFRSDFVHRRAFGVRHPKSVVQITGVMK